MPDFPYIPKTKEELQRDFLAAFERLVRAGKAFDEGHYSEAPRIAAEVYLFVHDRGRSAVSLLTHVGRRPHFVDTAATLKPRNLLTEHPLVLARLVSGGFEYIALRGDGPPPLYSQPTLPFLKWWDKPVLRDPKRRVYSRKNLIVYFRHTLGGGHVAAGFNPRDGLKADDLAALSRANIGGSFFSDGDQTLIPRYGPDYATVRQIGWELERTLECSCRDLVEQATLKPASAPLMMPVDRAAGSTASGR